MFFCYEAQVQEINWFSMENDQEYKKIPVLHVKRHVHR